MNKKSYPRHRFPSEIISHCVWLYNSFSLSWRDIEKMMLYTGKSSTSEMQKRRDTQAAKKIFKLEITPLMVVTDTINRNDTSYLLWLPQRL